jgi:uncharacterized protein
MKPIDLKQRTRKSIKMPLLFMMLPYYLVANLHCAGMCGPLVALLGHHRYRYFYFFGRTLSFSIAGLIAGEGGAVVNLFLHRYSVGALVSFLFGFLILYIGIRNVFNCNGRLLHFLTKPLEKINRILSLFLLRDQPWPTFLFGFFTLLLPCGQTVVVFSACALYGDPLAGLFNGFCFALLTSPVLLAAMQAHYLFKSLKKHYNQIMGGCSIVIGLLAVCRGLAELEIIPHLVMNSEALSSYHLVIY